MKQSQPGGGGARADDDSDEYDAYYTAGGIRKPTSKHDALVRTLILGLLAPDDAKAQQCVELAEGMVQDWNICTEQLECAKRQAVGFVDGLSSDDEEDADDEE